jgi:hypothetical protein
MNFNSPFNIAIQTVLGDDEGKKAFSARKQEELDDFCKDSIHREGSESLKNKGIQNL